MSPRATIACKQDDGRYTADYLHLDGYPDHACNVLKENHTSIQSGRALVAGGDIHSLANDGKPELFADGNRMVTMPTRAALHYFARHCDDVYIACSPHVVSSEWETRPFAQESLACQ